MMPTTVPNSPMNGVMLAVVARNDTWCSSLFTSTTEARSSARSTAVEALQGWTTGGRPRTGTRVRRVGWRVLPQLGGELRVAGLKEADERAVLERSRRRPALRRTCCSGGRRPGTGPSGAPAPERPQLVER